MKYCKITPSLEKGVTLIDQFNSLGDEWRFIFAEGGSYYFCCSDPLPEAIKEFIEKPLPGPLPKIEKVKKVVLKKPVKAADMPKVLRERDKVIKKKPRTRILKKKK